jgi:cysteine desulfurase
MSDFIYLDHAATTPIDPRVLEAMLPYLTENWGNPGGIYRHGQRARAAVDTARQVVAEILNCEAREIIFMSGGTESDNLALRGSLRSDKTGHLITTAIEHHAVLHTADDLERDGYAATYLPVDKLGQLTASEVEKAIREDLPTGQAGTKLVSIMYANNEIGTILPIREIGKMLEKRREKGLPAPLLHTDAVQAGGTLELNVKHLKVDLLSLSGHKFYGPKGVGCLFVKAGTKLRPQQTGGGQEHRRRASTENVAGIVGFAEALKLAHATRETENARQTELRDYLIGRVLSEIPKTRLNGDPLNRLPNNANFSFWAIEGESILLRLDFEKICGSSGSACTSGTLDPSHVLLALGLGHEWAHGSLRLTLGKNTTKAELDETVEKLKKIVIDLRAISPIE